MKKYMITALLITTMISMTACGGNKNTDTPAEETFVTKTLQKDLLDYSVYIKDKIAKKRPIVDKLIHNVQITVNEITNDYTVNLYGSYGTGLCLPWSDLDIVLVCKGPNALVPTFLLNQICMGIKSKPWVQIVKIIESTKKETVCPYWQQPFSDNLCSKKLLKSSFASSQFS